MKSTTNRKAILLMVSGLAVVAITQIISRYVEMQDFAKGCLVGIGLGLLFLAVISGKIKTAR